MSTKKKNEITVYTVIMCFMVIYIHITSEAVMGYDKQKLLYALAFATNKLCTFVVPGFIFISALKYFMRFTNGSFSYPKFLLDRMLKIYLPYVCWVVFYYICFVRQGYFPFSFKALGHYILYGDLAANFYFVIIIMQLYLLMPLWRLCAKVKSPAAVLLVCAVVMYVMRMKFIGFRYNDRVFTSYLLYWAAGIFCGLHYEKFLALCKKYRPAGYFLYFITASAHVYLCYLSSRGIFYYRYAEQIHMLFCLVSLIFVFDLCVLTAPAIPRLMPFFTALSKGSYYIYLSHVILIIFINSLTPGLGISARLLVKAVIVYTVPALLSVVYVRFKELAGKKLTEN